MTDLWSSNDPEIPETWIPEKSPSAKDPRTCEVKSSGSIPWAVSELTDAMASSVHPTAVHQLFSSVPGYAGMDAGWSVCLLMFIVFIGMYSIL